MRSQGFDVDVYIDKMATQTLVRLYGVRANQDLETYGGE